LPCCGSIGDDEATDLSGLGIYLLGKPRVERDGEAVSNPRGYEAAGLLA
jgi:hypothetical protein